MSCTRGEIEETDRNAAILREISEFILEASVTGIGFVVGSLLSAPILGGTLGMVAGVILGYLAGRMIGYKLAEVQAQKAIEEAKEAEESTQQES